MACALAMSLASSCAWACACAVAPAATSSARARMERVDSISGLPCGGDGNLQLGGPPVSATNRSNAVSNKYALVPRNDEPSGAAATGPLRLTTSCTLREMVERFALHN